jgi:hypothetical protein
LFNHFNMDRHLNRRNTFKKNRSAVKVAPIGGLRAQVSPPETTTR